MGLRTDLVRMFAKAQSDTANMVAVLPKSVQHLLVRILGNDNRLLNADDAMKIILAANRLIGTPLVSKNYQQSRMYFEQQMRFMQGDPLSLFKVSNFSIPSSQYLETNNPHLLKHMVMPSHDIAVRHYQPTAPINDTPQSLMVYFHGGGFTIGSVNTHDEFCRYFSLYSGMQVLSVDYRLAPEHPAPAGLIDCMSALQWAYDHAKQLKIDAQAIFVGGDSAGGNLAAVVSQQCKNTHYAPKAQLLIYPVTDASQSYPSHVQYGEGYTLTLHDRNNFDYFYIHQGELKPNDPLISPLLGNMAQTAPAYVVTAEIDLLVDEAEAYAHKLRASGVATFSERVRGLPHGFINLLNVHAQARLEVLKLAQQFSHFVTTHALPQHHHSIDPSSTWCI